MLGCVGTSLSLLRAIAGNRYLTLAHCQEKIPSPLSGSESEAKEKCCKDQTVGKDQSEASRKRPHCLTKNAFPGA
jgi:hypothetical protein